MKLYGAKCHLCTHIRHEGSCDDCQFCQHDGLLRLVREAGLDLFAPNVRDAVAAFRRGDNHPLVDRLRNEMGTGDTSEATA